MNSFVAALVPVLGMMVGAGFVLGFGWFARARLWRGKRKSPFTGLFLRSPGHSLTEQIDDLSQDLMGLLMLGFMAPVLLIAIVGMQIVLSGTRIGMGGLLTYGIALVVGLSWLGIKAYRTVGRMRQLRLGYEGETGVGQELAQLMRLGFRVYHDFPADNFNIDHIVIGPTGVFAVETKGRAKPSSGDGRKDARLDYDGQILRFPTWSEAAPIQQAERQAQWLSKWLSSAVGETVPVVAVLAVPGWFITRTKPAPVLVFNGKRPDKVFPQYVGKPLDPAMVQRIAHQVEAKCRDVVPRAYKQS